MKKIILLGSIVLSLAVDAQESLKLKSIDTTYIDNSFSPRDDFFRFCNNNWIKNNPIPASESRWGSFNELEQSNNLKLTKILEDVKQNPGAKGSQSQLLGDYYASFINMDIRNKKGLSPIQSDLDKIKAIKNKKDVLTMIADLHMEGVSTLFGFGVGQDLKNVSKNISYISQSGIGLPNCDYYLQEDKAEILKKYELYVAKVFLLMNYTEAQSKDMASSIVAFEKNLAQSMMRKAE